MIITLQQAINLLDEAVAVQLNGSTAHSYGLFAGEIFLEVSALSTESPYYFEREHNKTVRVYGPSMHVQDKHGHRQTLTLLFHKNLEILHDRLQAEQQAKQEAAR